MHKLVELRDVVPISQRLQIAKLEQHRGVPDSKRYPITIRPLGNRRVILRGGTSDPNVLCDTFVGLYHLPPPEVPQPKTILDLGSNIGLTIAHFAELFSGARILGVELDPETASVAQQNIVPWAGRCTLLIGAAWTSDEPVRFGRMVGEEFGAHVGGNGDQVEVPGHSLNRLVQMLGGNVDYLKMDIEGGEQFVLAQNTEWASRVKSMKIEVHAPYTREECLKDVEALGFTARPDDKHRSGIVAIRNTT